MDSFQKLERQRKIIFPRHLDLNRAQELVNYLPFNLPDLDIVYETISTCKTGDRFQTSTRSLTPNAKLTDFQLRGTIHASGKYLRWGFNLLGFELTKEDRKSGDEGLSGLVFDTGLKESVAELKDGEIYVMNEIRNVVAKYFGVDPKATLINSAETA